MKPIDKKKKTSQSIFQELSWGIISLFLGDITSKIGWTFLSLLLGVVVLTCPIVDNGITLKKPGLQYAISSALIILSVFLIISWLRKRKRKF
jgi:hypothetical protein